MYSFVFLACVSGASVIDDDRFERYVMRNGDRYKIGSKQRTVVIAIQPHGFSGELGIGWGDGKHRIKAEHNKVYWFRNTEVDVSFDYSLTSVSLSVFVLETDAIERACSVQYSVYTRSARSVSANLPSHPLFSSRICYFLDFNEAPVVSSLSGQVRAIAADKVHFLNGSAVGLRFEKMFVLPDFRDYDHGSVVFTTSEKVVDTGISETGVTSCDAHGDCSAHSFDELGIVVQRGAEWWIWLGCCGGAVLALVGTFIPLCLPKRLEKSVLASSKRFGSDLPTYT